MKNEKMSSFTFFIGLMLPALLMALIIAVGFFTFKKSNPDDSLKYIYMLGGIEVITPLALVTIYFKQREVENGKAKGYLYSSYFWILSLLMMIWFFWVR
ncbi:hypothetical protein [Pontibacter mangrovi]|uniref:Stationary phase survival protein SurE n=1 Tax=Pontibacter mangrovi TaxID=2589816 RepID=A0A501W7L4_9BACT|nr:hypothetical protein [Pontibacter mangrovi]TPE43241.1 hypothetical protein FJM65_14095 [Pontibacter mangrovi]